MIGHLFVLNATPKLKPNSSTEFFFLKPNSFCPSIQNEQTKMKPFGLSLLKWLCTSKRNNKAHIKYLEIVWCIRLIGRTENKNKKSPQNQFKYYRVKRIETETNLVSDYEYE